MRGTTTAAGFNLTAGSGLSGIVPGASPYTVMLLVRVASVGARRIFLGDFNVTGNVESICMEQQAANTWRFYHADSGGSAIASTGGTVTTGWHWVEFGWDGAQVQGRVDGASLSAGAAVNPRRAGTDLRALRGGAFTSLGFDGDIAFIGIWKRFLPFHERDSIRANPWQLYQPTKRNAVFGVGGGATNYTLTGNDAGLTFARSMTADVGSYTLNGVDAGLLVGRRLTADAGAYALAGVDANLIYTALGPTAYALTAETGSYVLTGNAAGLTYMDGGVLIDTHDGFWAKEWKRIRAREKRKYQEEIQERVEEIQDEIAEVEQQIVEVKQAPKPKKATPARDFYAEQARIVEHLIARRNQLIDEEDEELLLLL